MRKKDILGNYVKNPDVLYVYEIKKVAGEAEAYTALITFLEGSRELYVEDGGKEVCLSGAGYKWLVYMPMDEYWCMTAFFAPNGELFEWYFDISKGNFVDEEGMPCTDDMYLDLVVVAADGRMVTLDVEELQEALDKGEITVDNYNHAYAVHDHIKSSKWSDVDFLNELTGNLMKGYGV